MICHRGPTAVGAVAIRRMLGVAAPRMLGVAAHRMLGVATRRILGVASQRDRGSAGVWVLALSGVLLLAGAASVLAGVAIISRHQAGTAADLAALAAASQAISGSEVACAKAQGIAVANEATMESCGLAADGVVDVTVTVPVEFGPLGVGVARARARAGPAEVGGHPSGTPVQAVDARASMAQAVEAKASSTASSVLIDAFLCSGELPLPHLGDCTHEGQPDSHRQLAIVARVAVSHSRIAS